MKVGFSYWGFCEDNKTSTVSKTPDGHRYGRPIFVTELQKRGHQVIALQEKREFNESLCDSNDYKGFPEIDILFVEWRWPTWKNSGDDPIESDYKRQTELINHYHGNIPVVLWDTDSKMTAEDELKWPKAIIADHALLDYQITRKREKIMFWSDWKDIFVDLPKTFQHGYVGNNYERDLQFAKYYDASAKHLRSIGVQTKVHGNWLEVSPERESPANVIKKYEHIAFCDRLSFYESMRKLNSFMCTTHITKDKYAKYAYVTARYLESIACNTVGLVPEEFAESSILGKQFVVSSASDVVEKVTQLSKLSEQQLSEIVCEQKFALQKRSIFSVDYVVKYLESLV